MSTVLERLAPGARVAVIRLRSLGDCVLTTPAISLLKQTRPDLKIGVVVEDAFVPIFQGNPDIETLVAPKISQIARFRPDLALNLHGGSTSVRLTVASMARLRAGFQHFRFQPIYNVHIPRAQEILNVDRKVHTAEHLASAMFFLGVPAAPIPRARLFAPKRSRPGAYAALHPMASAPDKIWPHSNFLALADHLKHSLGLEPIFISGPGESLQAFSRYTCFEGASLEEIKSLLAGASLFAGNDSGPAHMAAAFGLPVIVFFGSSDADVWHPWQTESMVLKSAAGIQSIGVAEAVQAVEKVFVHQ
ncbi:MAG TPA: glycosyltransferase family 9 protein [Bryobacteraceae bacterium]|nr:glycosyltransferase family 9 protein [Bryobacteraceae bacterium]